MPVFPGESASCGLYIIIVDRIKLIVTEEFYAIKLLDTDSKQICLFHVVFEIVYLFLSSLSRYVMGKNNSNVDLNLFMIFFKSTSVIYLL